MRHPRGLPRLASVAIAAAIAARPLLAQDTTVAERARSRDTAQTLRTVEIVGSASGRGATRTANAVGVLELQSAPAGTSALKVIERLPGVNFQSSDPFGTYEWSNRVTIRGFQPQQIGQTFDGVPLGDMSYGNFNGLGVGRAVDPENLETATVTQGSGALGTASANNLGGVVQYSSGAPRPKLGVTVKQMLGSASARKTFARVDAGLRQLGATAGVQGFVSASRIDHDKWKGGGERFSPTLGRGLLGQSGLLGDAGEVWQDQVNAKGTLFVGAHKVTAYYNFADRKEADYADLSLRRYAESGRDWDQFSDWGTAREFAATAVDPDPANYRADEAYFHSAQGARRDHLAYLSADFQVGAAGRLVVSPYYHANRGAGDWHAPSYGASWSPDLIYFRQTQYDSRRAGANARYTTPLGARNTLEGGLWYEANTSDIRRLGWRMSDVEQGPAVNFDDVLRLFFDRTGEITSTTAYLQNRTALAADRLSVTYGAKYVRVDADFESNGVTVAGLDPARAPDANRPSASFRTEGNFLPQVGAVYSVTGSEQLFANWSENVNNYPYSPQSGVYNTSPDAFAYFKENTDPERATTVEVGARTRRDRVEASFAVYNIAYRNRLVGVSVCPLTATCVSSFANVGDVSSRGAEGLLVLTLAPGLSWYNSGSYSVARIEDDYVAGRTGEGGDVVVPAGGKDVVDAPRVMLNSGLRLRRGGLTAGVGGRHVAARYISILNDAEVPSYTVADANLGYRFASAGPLKDLSISVNAVNLFDESYISTVGTGGFAIGAPFDDARSLQTLQSGVPRQLFVTVGTSF